MDERADPDEDHPSLVEDSDSEDEDDVEMIEAGQDREQQIEDTVRSILRCSDRPSTRDELTRLGRTPNPAGPTPSASSFSTAAAAKATARSGLNKHGNFQAIYLGTPPFPLPPSFRRRPRLRRQRGPV